MPWFSVIRSDFFAALDAAHAASSNDRVEAFCKVGGSVENILYGDTITQRGEATGGNDRLISGKNATDEMWGDWKFGSEELGGEDTFVFQDNFADDFVYDFRRGEDLIEFDAKGFGSFDELVFTDVNVGGVTSTQITSNKADITDSVTLVGYDNNANPLNAEDFIFKKGGSNIVAEESQPLTSETSSIALSDPSSAGRGSERRLREEVY